MDTGRIGRGEMIAAVSAVALFLIMIIFTWFSVDIPTGGFDVDTGANAFQAFEFIDIILMITIIIAIVAAALSANATAVGGPVALSAVTALFGILSVILILFRIISPPDGGAGDFGVELDIGRGIGVFLGLIAAGGIAYGGWLGMQEEGTSFADQADSLRGGGAPPPPAA